MSGGSLLHTFNPNLNDWEKYQQAVAPVGFQQITDLSAATALTVPEGAKVAIIQAEAQNIRYRDDGTDPTSSVGMLITAGYELVYTGDLAAVMLIASLPGAIANISYYR